LLKLNSVEAAVEASWVDMVWEGRINEGDRVDNGGANKSRQSGPSAQGDGDFVALFELLSPLDNASDIQRSINPTKPTTIALVPHQKSVLDGARPGSVDEAESKGMKLSDNRRADAIVEGCHD
jgi:hypothetical protein